MSNIKSNLDNTFMEVITMFNRLIGFAKTHNWQEHYKPYIHLFKMAHNDILHVYSLHRGNNKHFLDLLIVLDPVVSQRFKRALLPLGCFLKSLFGTVSNKNLQKIKQAVQDLVRWQNGQGHLLSDGLSLINGMPTGMPLMT